MTGEATKTQGFGKIRVKAQVISVFLIMPIGIIHEGGRRGRDIDVRMKTLFLSLAVLSFILVASKGEASVLLRCESGVPGPGPNCATTRLAQVELESDGTTEIVVQEHSVSTHQVCTFEGCYDPGDCKAGMQIDDGFAVEKQDASFIGASAFIISESQGGYWLSVPSKDYVVNYDKDQCVVSK
jgi:hypothetical protein